MNINENYVEENMEIDKLVELGLTLKKQKEFQESINLLEQVIIEYPDYKKNNGIKVVIAGNYYELGEYDKAIHYADKVVLSNPDVEIANLLLYLSYFNLDNHEKAFQVLFNYLEHNPADSFKDTLEELMEGLLDGYGMNYKDKIIYYSKKNNINVPNELIG